MLCNSEGAFEGSNDMNFMFYFMLIFNSYLLGRLLLTDTKKNMSDDLGIEAIIISVLNVLIFMAYLMTC